MPRRCRCMRRALHCAVSCAANGTRRRSFPVGSPVAFSTRENPALVQFLNQWGIFNPVENKRLPDNVPPRPELEVRDGDVLVTRKNTYDLVAACALVRNPPQRLLLPDTIFRFRLGQSSRLSSVFLWGLFSFPSFRKRVQNLASGSTQVGVSWHAPRKLGRSPLTLQCSTSKVRR